MAGGAAENNFNAPEDHAIVVGIDRYRNPGIYSLRGAVNDANLFREWLIRADGGGLNPNNVKCVLSGSNGAAYTPSVDEIVLKILEYFDQMENTGRPVGRRLYLFFAGHGVAPPIGNDCSLIAANSPYNPLWGLHGVMTADIVRKQPMFQEVVLFMACCRIVAGNAPVWNGLPSPTAPLPNSNFLHGLAVKWQTPDTERDLPNPLNPAGPHLRQSLFAHSLLKGLMSAQDDQGAITSLSLKDFVKKQVQDLLPPAVKRPPDFNWDDNLPPVIFRAAPPPAAPAAPAAAGPAAPPAAAPAAAADTVVQPAGLIPVEVTLAAPGAVLEVLDGETLKTLETEILNVEPGKVSVRLKPGLYAFRAAGHAPVPVRVLGEAIRVAI